MNWLIEEAEKCNSSEDRIILENPEAIRKLDDILISDYYPFIKAKLEKTNFLYYPVKSELKIESKWSGQKAGRSLTFMLFDDFNGLFFRGSIVLSKDSFLLKKEFFLELPEETKPSYLFKILKDERFSALPPSLEIQNSKYNIKIESGSGFSIAGCSLHNIAKNNIEAAIQDSVRMFELSMIEGFQSMEDVKKFLAIASRFFDAY
jgi:hypothetical protein